MSKMKRFKDVMGDGMAHTVHELTENGGNAPLDLQPEEVVWTTYRGHWERVTITKVEHRRSQSNVQYHVEEFATTGLDAAWFFRKLPDDAVLA